MSNNKRKLALIAATGTALLLAGCETTSMKMGSPEAKTVATGSAAGAATSGENTALEKCASPLGTVSLVENQTAGWYTILTGEYKLPPTANLLRLLARIRFDRHRPRYDQATGHRLALVPPSVAG